MRRPDAGQPMLAETGQRDLPTVDRHGLESEGEPPVRVPEMLASGVTVEQAPNSAARATTSPFRRGFIAVEYIYSHLTRIVFEQMLWRIERPPSHGRNVNASTL
jgi:hypothetical protein